MWERRERGDTDHPTSGTGFMPGVLVPSAAAANVGVHPALPPQPVL